MNTLIKPCPYCEENGDTVLEETQCGNFLQSIAVTCLECGLRGMAAEDDEMAVKIWNEMAEYSTHKVLRLERIEKKARQLLEIKWYYGQESGEMGFAFDAIATALDTTDPPKNVPDYSHCSNCGAPNPVGETICGWCGLPLSKGNS